MRLRGLTKKVDPKLPRVKMGLGERSVDGRARTDDERLTIIPTQQDWGRPPH